MPPKNHVVTSHMARETAAAPQLVAAQLAANAELLRGLAQRLRDNPPRLVVTCARGSSDHAATFAKYIIEQKLGIPVLSFTPSLASLHGRGFGGSDVLFLAISQSGGSPDILAAAKLAHSQGALVVAMLNVVASPLAGAADVVVPLHAGEERSVAATKSYIATLSALLQLATLWAGQAEDNLAALPAALRQGAGASWSAAVPALAKGRSLYVIGRGAGLAIAQEIALKFKEAAGIHAEAFSGAEARHGPMALVGPGFPVILIGQNDVTLPTQIALAEAMVAQGAEVFTCGVEVEGAVALPSIAAPALTGLPAVALGLYTLVDEVARARGLNPDNPRWLTKVTCTL